MDVVPDRYNSQIILKIINSILEEKEKIFPNLHQAFNWIQNNIDETWYCKSFMELCTDLDESVRILGINFGCTLAAKKNSEIRILVKYDALNM
jgi:hypothetical protein